MYKNKNRRGYCLNNTFLAFQPFNHHICCMVCKNRNYNIFKKTLRIFWKIEYVLQVIFITSWGAMVFSLNLGLMLLLSHYSFAWLSLVKLCYTKTKAVYLVSMSYCAWNWSKSLWWVVVVGGGV